MSFPVAPVVIQNNGDLAKFKLASLVRKAFDEMNLYFQAVCLELNPDSSKWKKKFAAWTDEDQKVHRVAYMKKKDLCKLFLQRRNDYDELIESFCAKVCPSPHSTGARALLLHTNSVSSTLSLNSSASQFQLAWLLHSPLAKSVKTLVFEQGFYQASEDLIVRALEKCKHIENIHLKGPDLRFVRNCDDSIKLLKCIAQRTYPFREIRLKNFNVDVDFLCCKYFVEIMTKCCPQSLHLALSGNDNVKLLPQFLECLKGTTQLRSLAYCSTKLLFQLLSPSVEHFQLLTVSPGVAGDLKTIVQSDNDYKLSMVTVPHDPDGFLQLKYLLKDSKLLCIKYVNQYDKIVHIEYASKPLDRKWHKELTEWTIAMMPLELPAYILLYILEFDVLPPFGFELPAVSMPEKKTIDLLSGLCRARQKVFDQRQ